MKVVQLHSAPALTDIPGRLRHMAAQIESGEIENVESMIILIPNNDGFPQLFGFGDVEGRNQPIIQLEFAKHWLINNITGR